MSCYRTCNAASKLYSRTPCTVSRFLCTTSVLNQRVEASRVDVHHPKETILIPKRKKRSPVSLLEALSSTVEKDHTASPYRYLDDPYLIPSDSFNKRNFSLSKAAGKKAAKYLVNRYSKYVREMYDFAEPKIEAYQVNSLKYTHPDTDTTELALLERIERRDVTGAMKTYSTAQSRGEVFSQVVLERFLELLCVYNSEPPAAEFERDEAWYRRDMEPQDKVRQPWRKGLVEEVFESLLEKSATAYCSLIRAYSKYNNNDGAWQLYCEMKDLKLPVSLSTCNSVVKICPFLSESADNKWHRIMTVLKDIQRSGLSPDLATFNSVLFSLSRMSRYRRSRTLAFQTLAEMKECGVQPSLASFHYVLRIVYDTDDVQAPVLGEIISFLENGSLTLLDPADLNFFPTAMQKCYHNLQDLELAYRIDTLLNSDNNITFLGDSGKEMSYYSCFFRVVCLLDNLENIMKLYDQIAPNIWTPTLSALDELLKALELHDGLKHLPLIWSDLVLFRYNRNASILKQLISLMAKEQHEPELQSRLSEVALAIKRHWIQDQEANLRNPMELTGALVSDLILVSLRAGDVQQAWDFMDLTEKESRKIGGLLSSQALAALFDSYVIQEEIDQALACLDHLVDLGLPETQELIDRLRALQLTESQRSRLDNVGLQR